MRTEKLKNIQTLSDLKLEIVRLTAQREFHEKRLNEHVKAYAHSLRPANLIKNAFKGMGNDKELTGMLKTKGAEAAIGFVISQLLFKNSNLVMRTAATIFGTSFATGIFGEEASKYVDKIKNAFRKFKSGRDPQDNNVFREEDIYKG